MSQVDKIAQDNHAVRVTSVTIGMGPISGVEEQLLKDAYPVASAGTIADGAILQIQMTPLKVKCTKCGKESKAEPNRLVCGCCNDWRTELLSGDELVLLRVELDKSEVP